MGLDLVMVVLLVTLSGVFSGLTLGLFSLAPEELERKIQLNSEDAHMAVKVYPVRKDGNLLLCTLLLGNVAVNSALSIFLGELASGVVGGIIATGLIVIFGEILPQASFSRHALKVGASTVWLVKIFRFVLYPICKPIAVFLDKMLGAELPTIYDRKELAHILEEHQKDNSSEIEEDDARIAIGALTYSDKKLQEIMVPFIKVILFNSDVPVDRNFIEKIKSCPHSYLPVFDPKKRDVIGVFKRTHLIGISGNEGIKVEDLIAPHLYFELEGSMNLDRAMEQFLEKRRSLAIIRDEHGTVIGVCSLENIIEEIIQVDIIDDDDLD